MDGKSRYEQDSNRVLRLALEMAPPVVIFVDEVDQALGGRRGVSARGFEAIGGLEHIVAYLKSVVYQVRMHDLEAAPRSILLTGPPGTGKTMIAEALANEAGYNFRRMCILQRECFAESERRLDTELWGALEEAPVVILVEDIDHAFGTRDSYQNGDSGVSARIIGRIVSLMGKKELRGRVLWIAETNRPDMVDEAMIDHCFDRVFPFFMPSAAERAKIFSVMPSITGAVYAPQLDLQRAVARTEGLTGSAIEQIVRGAAALAEPGPVTAAAIDAAIDDYKPNQHSDVYVLQSLLALQATHYYSSLPPFEDLPEEIREVLIEMRTSRSGASLRRRIAELKARLAGEKLL